VPSVYDALASGLDAAQGANAMTGPQHPEFKFEDGDVITISDSDARRIVAALLALDATAPPSGKAIPYAKAMARVEAATQLNAQTAVDLRPREDTAVLRALEVIGRAGTTNELDRLRQALLRSGAARA
jgi:hypothetical protein